MINKLRLRLAHKIRSLRKKKGLTQEQLSGLADMDYKYIQRIESKNPPSIKIDTIGILAKALKVKPADLLK